MPTSAWMAPVNNTAAQAGSAGVAMVAAATLAISPTGTANPDYVLNGGVAYPGMPIRFTASGIFTLSSTACNATFALKYGGTGGVTLATTTALAMLVSVGPVSWTLNALTTIRSTGTAGTAWTTGQVSGIVATAPMSDNRMDSSVYGTPAVAAFNTVAGGALVLNCTLSASTSVTITCEQFLVEYG